MTNIIPNSISTQFPILKRKFNGKKLVYLDNGATTQKPQVVIDALVDYYENHNANVHRGIHSLSEEATDMYEKARETVCKFIDSPKWKQIIFTKNATDSLNMVAFGWGMKNLKKGDVILTTDSEHNSNVLPWVRVSELVGSKVKYFEAGNSQEECLKNFKKAYNDKVKVVAISHASNVLGTIFPVKEISKCLKSGTILVVDGSQAAPHLKVSVSKLGAHFYAFSGHKMLGPMGIGVLWGDEKELANMMPASYGGGMVNDVNYNNYELSELPEEMEAGTPNVAGAIGLAVAIDFLNKIGMDKVREHEVSLLKYAFAKMKGIKGLEIIGPQNPQERTGLISFTLGNIHPHDLATILNDEGIAVRSGRHCAMTLHKKLKIMSTTRASFYVYNTEKDVDALCKGIIKAQKILGN